MLWTNIKRVLRSGFVSFWRNTFVSLSSILVMTVTLFVLGSIVFIGATLDASLEQIREKVDVNVYFVTTAPEGDILTLKGRLEQLPEVAEVEYVTSLPYRRLMSWGKTRLEQISISEREKPRNTKASRRSLKMKRPFPRPKRFLLSTVSTIFKTR